MDSVASMLSGTVKYAGPTSPAAKHGHRAAAAVGRGTPRDELRLPGTPSPRGTLEGLRILFVEDDADARELVTAVLSAEGADVETASSAEAGFCALRRFRPQLLVSDIAMPGEDGYSLIRRIRALGADGGGHIPSIALTAFTRAEDVVRALDAGFTLHIGKPVLPSTLVSAMQSLASSVGC